MIIISLFGGLGNQMFQYAFGRHLSRKLSIELKYDYSFNLTRKDFSSSDILFIYDIFNLIGIPASKNEISNSNLIREKPIFLDKSILSISSNNILSGYWQNECYFKDSSDIIKNDFTFKTLIDNSNNNIASEIEEYNSVSIHIRGRDYINKASTRKIHNTCDKDYYYRAINYMLTKIKNPIFYIFSDDPEWAHKLLDNIPAPYKFVECTSWNIKSHEDMRLMSMCKHNIIANSSFSWWAAWLNNNNNKLVIAPSKWFAISKMNNQAKDLVPKSWMKI
jgi:hypothetical protein